MTYRELLDAGIDPIAVELACAGETVHLLPRERREAVRQLTAKGGSHKTIARALRIAENTVVRHRAQLRAAS